MKKQSKRTVLSIDASAQSRLLIETLNENQGPLHARALTRKVVKQLTNDMDPAAWVKEQFQRLTYILIDRNYLEDSGNRLTPTIRAAKVLDQSQKVMVYENQLRWNATERKLYQELRKIRMRLAKQDDYRPYIIFPDQAMDELVRHHPTNLKELQKIYGWGPHRVNRYGMAILKCIEEVHASMKKSRYEQLLVRSKRDSYQQVKSLFLAGESPEDIAAKRGVKVGTVNHMLSELYEAGVIDMYPWIEQNIPSALFERGASYFRKHDNALVKEAFKKLGIDYEVLKLCRLYIIHTEKREEELAWP